MIFLEYLLLLNYTLNWFIIVILSVYDYIYFFICCFIYIYVYTYKLKNKASLFHKKMTE